MGGAIGKIFGGAGPAAVPAEDGTSEGGDASVGPMAPKKRAPSPLMQGIGAGLKTGGDNYDAQQAAIARSGRPVAFNVQQPQVAPDLMSSDYLKRAKQRFSPSATDDLFFGG